MNNLKFTLIATLLVFVSCSSVDYHPYDGYITGETNLNEKNCKRIEEACRDKDTIRFAFIGDTQLHYNEANRFVKAVNKRNDIDFVIHGGDVAEAGMTDEFIWYRDLMKKLKFPYVTILGNHDCIATGKDVYRKMYGEYDFSFIAGNIKFVCLNTNAIEFNYSTSVPNIEFIENEQKNTSPEHQKTVVAMHIPPYNVDFNNNMAPWFQHMIKQFTELQFCLNAHEHIFRVKDIFEDGVIYYGCPSIEAEDFYLVFTITANGYDYEKIDF